MVLFGRKKNKTEEVIAEKSAKKAEAVATVPKETPKPASKILAADDSVRAVLVSPRVTEKVTMLNETRNVYTFEIGRSATKKSISEAVKRLYKVTPVKVRILPIQRKRVFVRGKAGFKGGGRKAYIYLKAGDKMDMA